MVISLFCTTEIDGPKSSANVFSTYTHITLDKALHNQQMQIKLRVLIVNCQEFAIKISVSYRINLH